MIKTIASRVAVLTATACMVFSPIAAQAHTRAGDSGALYSANALSQPGFGRDINGLGIANDDDDDDDDLGLILLMLLGGAGAIAAILVIDDDDDQSPGT